MKDSKWYYIESKHEIRAEKKMILKVNTSIAQPINLPHLTWIFDSDTDRIFRC